MHPGGALSHETASVINGTFREIKSIANLDRSVA